MKDKYDRYVYDNEGKNLKIEKIKINLLKLKYYLHVLKKAGFKDFEDVAGSSIGCIVSTLDIVKDYWQKWIINNIISCVNKENLMLTYINHLNKLLVTKDFDKINIVMNSFKKSGIIKDIQLSQNKKWFQLETLDDQRIKFNPEFSNEEDIEFYNRHCHAVTEALCHKVDNVYATTVLMKNYFNNSYYHSFVVKDGLVHDFAQNIVMGFENYKELFGCKVIMCIEGKQLLRNIEKLKEIDAEFRKNESCNILKYAMHKQMKKEKNMAK